MRIFARYFLSALAVTAISGEALAQGKPLDLSKTRRAPAAKAIQNSASPPRVANMSAAQAVQKANAYFNGIRTMVADFSQVGADGKRTTGKLYVSKPGRMRFEYDRPSPYEIIADGRSVAIRNRTTAKQDVYFISQTPLKFLLKGRINLAKDTKILNVRTGKDVTYIRIEDKSTFGGTSRIQLFFDPKTFQLRQWIVRDAQGYLTKVRLANIDFKTRPSKRLFRINHERLQSLD